MQLYNLVAQRGLPGRIVDTGDGTGTDESVPFSVPVAGDWAIARVIVSGTVTALVYTLQSSTDGGTTWVTVAAGLDLIASNPQLHTLTPGVLYRINITTFTTANSGKVHLVIS